MKTIKFLIIATAIFLSTNITFAKDNCELFEKVNEFTRNSKFEIGCDLYGNQSQMYEKYIDKNGEIRTMSIKSFRDTMNKYKLMKGYKYLYDTTFITVNENGDSVFFIKNIKAKTIVFLSYNNTKKTLKNIGTLSYTSMVVSYKNVDGKTEILLGGFKKLDNGDKVNGSYKFSNGKLILILEKTIPKVKEEKLNDIIPF